MQDSSNNTPVTDQGDRSDHKTVPSKKPVIIIGVIAAVIIAALLAVVIVLLLKDKDTSEAVKESSNSQSQTETSDNKTTPVTGQKTVVASSRTKSDKLWVDLYEPKRSGNTLILNYRIYNKDSEGDVLGSGLTAGIYQSFNSASTPKPYVVADNDGQKYGLVKDDNGEDLATNMASKYLEKGESINGYVTVSLPPNNSVISVSLGSMPILTGITLKY